MIVLYFLQSLTNPYLIFIGLFVSYLNSQIDVISTYDKETELLSKNTTLAISIASLALGLSIVSSTNKYISSTSMKLFGVAFLFSSLSLAVFGGAKHTSDIYFHKIIQSTSINISIGFIIYGIMLFIKDIH